MFKERKTKISVKKIAEFLKSDYDGDDFEITSISSMNNIKNNSLLFYSELTNFKFKIKDNVEYDLKKLDKYENIAIISEGNSVVVEKKITYLKPVPEPNLPFLRSL